MTIVITKKFLIEIQTIDDETINTDTTYFQYLQNQFYQDDQNYVKDPQIYVHFQQSQCVHIHSGQNKFNYV